MYRVSLQNLIILFLFQLNFFRFRSIIGSCRTQKRPATASSIFYHCICNKEFKFKFMIEVFITVILINV